jgi:hypothetical protein
LLAKVCRRAKGFAHRIRELGWLDGSLDGLNRLLAALFGGKVRLHKYFFVVQPVAEKSWLPTRRGAGLEVRCITAADPIIAAVPRPEWAIPYRFGQGAICLAAVSDGSCVGFLWLALGSYQEDEVRCRYVPLPEGKAAWDFDVYVHPEHRNGIVFLKLWDAANSFLSARGVRWSLSRISAFNKGSMSSHARMKAKRIGTAVFLSIGPLQVSVATVAPYFALSGHIASFPTFALNAQRRSAEPGRS